MIESCIFLSFVLIPAIGIITFRSTKLSLDRDFLFFIYLGQVVVYIHMVPTINMFYIEQPLREMYALIQWSSWILFELPLLGFYLHFQRKLTILGNLNRILLIERININRLIYLAFIVCFSLAFLFIALKHDLFFRRIGHEDLALRSAGMTLFELVIYRSFSETSVFLIMVSMFLYFNTLIDDIAKKPVVMIIILFHVSIYGSFVMLNNRLQTIILLLLMIIVYKYWRNLEISRPIFTIRKLLSIILILAAASVAVSTMRTYYEETYVLGDEKANVGNLISTIQSDGIDLRERLDGISLMAKVTRPAIEKGFLWGETWFNTLELYYYVLFDPERARQIKISLKTNPKVYMAERYLNVEISDSSSSMLTDLYGNYFFYAFIPAAFFIALVLSFVSKKLMYPNSYYSLCIALYLLPFLFKFEKEFTTLCINILKFSPILFLVMTTKPFNFVLFRPEQQYR